MRLCPLLLLGCVSCASPPALHVPRALRSCPKPATVPAPLPPLVTPEAMRSAYDATEKARRSDHEAAIECRRALGEVVELVDAFALLRKH